MRELEGGEGKDEGDSGKVIDQDRTGEGGRG